MLKELFSAAAVLFVAVAAPASARSDSSTKMSKSLVRHPELGRSISRGPNIVRLV